MNGVFQVLMFILVFGSVIFLAYVTTRYVANKTSKAMKGKHISIVETLSLGVDKKLHLVKVSDQYVLIASTSKNIELLTSIEIEDTKGVNEEESTNTQNTFDFKAFFEKYMNLYKNKKINIIKREKSDSSINSLEGDKFKVNLDRLKSINKR